MCSQNFPLGGCSYWFSTWRKAPVHSKQNPRDWNKCARVQKHTMGDKHTLNKLYCWRQWKRRSNLKTNNPPVHSLETPLAQHAHTTAITGRCWTEHLQQHNCIPKVLTCRHCPAVLALETWQDKGKWMLPTVPIGSSIWDVMLGQP